MAIRRHTAPLVAALALSWARPAHPADTDVPQGIGLTSKDQAVKVSKKKPHVPAWQVEGATVGKAIGAVLVSAGSGWISGKAYPDNPLTDKAGDGPSVGKGMHDAGTAARWLVAYILPRGWLLGGYARLGITRGHVDGFDDEYDAWIVGARVGRIFYSKHSIDIFWFANLGYGHMRHRVASVLSPLEKPDAFTRRDLWPFTPRDETSILKKSGFMDVGLGALIIYHFTPIFGLVFEVDADFIAPDIAFNIDVAAGLGIAFP